MNLTPAQKTTTTLGVLVASCIAIWTAAEAWGAKADKTQIGPIWEEITSLKKDRAVAAETQLHMVKLMEKMDARMERIENNQQWQIQQEVKRLQWQTFRQEPSATPSPNVDR